MVWPERSSFGMKAVDEKLCRLGTLPLEHHRKTVAKTDREETPRSKRIPRSDRDPWSKGAAKHEIANDSI